MKAFMTPVLPAALPGSVTETDEVKNFSAPTAYRPSPPQGPSPSLSGAAKEGTSFRDVLQVLLHLHEAEIGALQKQVAELRCNHNGDCAADHKPHQFEKISPHRNTEWDEVQVVHLDDKLPPAIESTGNGGPLQAPNGKSIHQSSENKTHVKFVAAEDDRKLSGINEPSRGFGTDFVTDRASGTDRAFGTDRLLSTTKKDSVTCEDFVERKTTLRATFAVSDEGGFTLEQLLPCERRWVKLISDMYRLAQQHTSQLHEKWILSDSHVRKVASNNESVDVWATARAKRAGVRRGQAGRFASEAKKSKFSGRTSLSLRIQESMQDSSMGNLIKTELSYACKFLRSRGLKAFLEAYVVVLPHSGVHLVWVVVGMILMFYDAVIVPLQSFDLDESSGVLNFLQWTMAIFWTCDIIITFFTAIYIDVELVRDLKLIARRYLMSWLLFDLCILLPVWFEQLSLDQSGAADVKALKVVRVLRFFRLIRLAKFTFLMDEQLKAINSPSLILFFKLVRLVFGLIVFCHVNGCLWYSVGKNKDGWAVDLSDTDTLYKYLTSVHWTITQFSGNSEIAAGKFSDERAYALVTVLFSIMIFAAFLSNFTNIIMQLQSLTVERDHQIRDLCIYMRGHQIPRQLSIKVRNYLNWKSSTDKCKGCEALAILPERLVMEIEFEVYAPTIVQHEFFCEFIQVYPRLSRRVLHACLQPIYMSPEDLVFAAQETGVFMYFVVTGLLDYAVILRRASEALTLGRECVCAGVTLSEPTLWMHWQHRGTLMSTSYCHLLALNTESFRNMVQTHPPAHVSCNLYARRLIAAMAKAIWRCTDIIVPSHLISEEDSSFLDTIMTATMQKLMMAGNDLASRLEALEQQEKKAGEEEVYARPGSA